MKQLVYVVVAGVFLVGGLAGLMGSATAQGGMELYQQAGPQIVASTPLIKITKDAKVVIIGSGFEPGQAIRILFTPLDGVPADIGYALKPDPVPNRVGAFVTTWTCGRHLSKNITDTAYSLTVTDMDFKVLAQTPIAFYKEEAPKKEGSKKEEGKK